MKQNTNVEILKFSKAKSIIAVAMTPAQDALYVMGQELGDAAAEDSLAWATALKATKTPADRKVLREGFATAYCTATGKGRKAADNRFDYLARMHAPQSSRKAKHNAKRAKGGGRKEKKAGKGETLPPQVTAQRLTAVLHYIAKAQVKHMGDDEMLEVLGEIAAIAGGKKSK